MAAGDRLLGRLFSHQVDCLDLILSCPEIADRPDAAIVIESAPGEPLLRLTRSTLRNLKMELEGNTHVYDNIRGSTVRTQSYSSVKSRDAAPKSSTASGEAELSLPAAYAYSTRIHRPLGDSLSNAVEFLKNKLRRSDRRLEGYRKIAEMTVNAAKNRYEQMSLQERRTEYLAGHVTPESIPSWAESCPSFPTFDRYMSSLLSYPLDIPMDSNLLQNCKCGSDVELVKNRGCNERISIWNGPLESLEVDAVLCPQGLALANGKSSNLITQNIFENSGEDLMLAELKLLISDGRNRPVRVTCGYRLPAKSVIHVNLKEDFMEKSLLQTLTAIRSSLQLCKCKGFKTLAFPSFLVNNSASEKNQKAVIGQILQLIAGWLKSKSNKAEVERVILCTNSMAEARLYRNVMPNYFPLFSIKNEVIIYS